MTDGIRFDTRRDWDALTTLLKRSDLGLVDPGVVTIEPVVNADDAVTCDFAGDVDGHWFDCEATAAVRIVRNRSVEYDQDLAPDGYADVYSDAFCLACVQRELHGWVDTQLATMVEAVADARRDAEADVVTYATDPDDQPEFCGTCGEVIERGSVRWNGHRWEHKARNALPQAGHHAVEEVGQSGQEPS